MPEDGTTYRTFDGLRPHFDALARVGYFKIVPKPLSRSKWYLHNAYRFIACFLIIMYNVQHVIRVILVRHSTEEMVDTLFILLTTINTLGKQAAFNLRSRRIDDIIKEINGPYFVASKPYHVDALKANAVIMAVLLKLYHVAVFTCGTMWTIFPIVNRVLGEEVQFTGYIPFDTTETPGFVLALTYMSVLITFQAYGNTTMDCTIVAFYAQAKTQIQMLRYNLQQLVEIDDVKINKLLLTRSNEFPYYDNEKEKSVFQERLKNCVVHYRQILRFTKEVQSIFGEAMLIQLIVMAWVICMTTYKIVGISLVSAEGVSMVIYLGCMLAQLFIYCYFGTELKVERTDICLYVFMIHLQNHNSPDSSRELTVVPDLFILCVFVFMIHLLNLNSHDHKRYHYGKSEFINQSVYCSGWMSLSPRFQHQLLIMMQCFARPIAARIAYVIPMSLETYIAVLRAAYTLFTFLNQ